METVQDKNDAFYVSFEKKSFAEKRQKFQSQNEQIILQEKCRTESIFMKNRNVRSNGHVFI